MLVSRLDTDNPNKRSGSSSRGTPRAASALRKPRKIPPEAYTHASAETVHAIVTVRSTGTEQVAAAGRSRRKSAGLILKTRALPPSLDSDRFDGDGRFHKLEVADERIIAHHDVALQRKVADALNAQPVRSAYYVVKNKLAGGIGCCSSRRSCAGENDSSGNDAFAGP